MPEFQPGCCQQCGSDKFWVAPDGTATCFHCGKNMSPPWLDLEGTPEHREEEDYK